MSLLQKWSAFLDENFVFQNYKDPLDGFDEAYDNFVEKLTLTGSQQDWILDHEDFHDKFYIKLGEWLEEND